MAKEKSRIFGVWDTSSEENIKIGLQDSRSQKNTLRLFYMMTKGLIYSSDTLFVNQWLLHILKIRWPDFWVNTKELVVKFGHTSGDRFAICWAPLREESTILSRVKNMSQRLICQVSKNFWLWEINDYSEL